MKTTHWLIIVGAILLFIVVRQYIRLKAISEFFARVDQIKRADGNRDKLRASLVKKAVEDKEKSLEEIIQMHVAGEIKKKYGVCILKIINS